MRLLLIRRMGFLLIVPYRLRYLLPFAFMCWAMSALAFNVQVEDLNLQSCLAKLADKNGWQSAAEVTEITCHSADIKSLKGIKQFLNLEKLSLHKNNIGEVSLNGLQHLRHLNLARNALQKMHLSDLPALEELYLFRNQLRELTLTDLPALQMLKANSNALTLFTYSGLPSLEKIYLFDNDLKHMDIHSLPKLQYLDARHNPMSDELYDEMDQKAEATILHDGNADDW